MILYEFRNIYDDFQIFEEIIQKIFKSKPNISVELFSSLLLEKISNSYYYQIQKFGRLRILFQNYLSLNIAQLFKIIGENRDNFNIELFVSSVLNKLKKLLLITKNEIDQYSLHMIIPCPKSNWKYEYDELEDQYILSEKIQCSKNCRNFDRIGNSIYRKYSEIINNTLAKYNEICVSLGIKGDEKFIQKLDEYVKARDSGKKRISVRFCKTFGDFFITLAVNQDNKIITMNSNHFIPLLIIRNLNENIIELD